MCPLVTPLAAPSVVLLTGFWVFVEGEGSLSLVGGLKLSDVGELKGSRDEAIFNGRSLSRVGAQL